MASRIPESVTNFGRDIRFRPRRQYRPETEADVLQILNEHRGGTVRVIGARHSWNRGIESPDALVDLRRFHAIRVHEDGARVTVGAGCRIGPVLKHLASRGLTLPSIGLINRQTVAGAIATGTHGSGRRSMSHHVEALRIACYGADGEAMVRSVGQGGHGDARSGDPGRALRAARCSIGALGIVLEVTFRCVPQYYVTEQCIWSPGLTAILEREAEAPLQQFYLIPHSWKYLVHERRVAARNRRAGAAALYRAYRLLVIDVRLHLVMKFVASLLRSRLLVHLLYRGILRAFIVPRWRVTDRSDRQLLMRHDLFRHLEMEVFVPRARLAQALDLVTQILRAADDRGHVVTPDACARIERLGMRDAFEELRGSYVHHYPICVRRVLPDDTLLSMSSCEGLDPEDWYAISLITYARPRDPFQRVARFLATVLAEDSGARLHWGKWFPLGAAEVERGYPGLADFREVCEEFDPGGVFRNDFLEEVVLAGSNRRSILILSLMLLAGVALAAACGDDTTEPPPEPPRATTITVTPATTEFTALGATSQLSAEVRDQNGQLIAGATVNWGSSSPEVATVDATGLATAVGNGSATITASDTVRLAAEVRDANGHAVAGDASLTWSSSDPSVATVDGAGLVSGVALGTATVTAASASLQGTAQITVADVDRDVLVTFYEATNGQGWIENEGWLSDRPVGEWHGVTTDETGRVTALDLSASNLIGSILPELARLSHLETLDLERNTLTGSIPPELGELHNLKALILEVNRLSGQIPPELGNLTQWASCRSALSAANRGLRLLAARLVFRLPCLL